MGTNGLSRRSFLIILAGLLMGVGLGFLLLFGLGFGEKLLGRRDSVSAGGPVGSPAVDSPAPDFELERLSGGQVRLGDLQGQPVLINFWATWCAPCVVEMPILEKFYRQHSGEFILLAVNAGESREQIQDFLEDRGLTFDILLDPDNRLESLYRLRGYPTSFFINPEGVVKVHHIGPLSEAQVVEYLEKIGVGQ